MRAEELQQLIATASAGSAGEVVTRALSRDVRLPHGAGTAVLITLHNGRDHTRPNTLGVLGLGELNQALDTALGRDDIVAIAITGKTVIARATPRTRRLPGNSRREIAYAARVARITEIVVAISAMIWSRSPTR